MWFKSLEKTDKRILSASLALLLFSFTLIFNDSWVYNLTSTGYSELEKIGEVINLKNDVRRRHEVAFTWLPLAQQNQVYQGDSIFTGNSSGVLIKTTTGEEISIAANSLVVVKNRKDSVSIDIGFGSVEGKVQSGKTLRITSNNNLTELDGSNAVVKVDAGDGSKLVLNVIAGEIKVKSIDGIKVLKRNETTEIDTTNILNTPETNSVQILLPLANQRFRFAPNLPIEFRWKTARLSNRVKIKISTDAKMKNTLVDTLTQDNSYTAFNLPADQPLYWQVITENAKSEITPFYVVGTSPPQLISPLLGQQFYYDAAAPVQAQGTEVRLEWGGGSPATRYEIEVANNPIFESSFKLKTVEKTILTQRLIAGTYYWRTRSLDYADSPWSSTSNFKIGPEPTRFLPLPNLQLTENQFLLKTKVHAKKPEEIHSLRGARAKKWLEGFATFQWSRVAGAKGYRIQISDQLNFKNLIVDSTSNENFYTFRSTELGNYFWRVKALNENYKEGTFSKPQLIEIALAPPLSLTEQDQIEEVPDEQLLLAPAPPIQLKWNATVFTKSYHVQFSSRPNFEDAIEFFTSSDTKKIQISKPGSYFWRVRSLDEKKKPLSNWGTYKVSFARIYKDPALSDNLLALYPKQQDSLVIVGQGDAELLFKWNNPFPDSNYKIEISYEPNFKNIAHTAITKTNSFILKNRLISGTVYWRVRAERGGETSPWTAANRFYVTYEGRPFDYQTSELLFAARLKARERQQTLLAEAQRQIAKLRTPASKLEWQLEKPNLTYDRTEITLLENWPAQMTQAQLNKQNVESFYSQVKDYPTLTWNKVTAAERYFIEISKDKEFKNIIVKAPSFNPYYLWETVRPGQFYWRVQAFNDRYSRSDYSDARELKVTVNSPTILNEDTFVEILDEPREMWHPPKPIQLRWKPVLFSRAYEIEFSNSIDFANKKTFKTDQDVQEIRVDYSGLYYYRLKALNDYGVAISPWTQIRSIEFVQTSRQPAHVKELTGLFPKNRTLVYVGKGQIKVPFHFTSPYSGSFDVEVANDADFKNIIAKTTTNEGAVKISTNWPEGRIFWRVKNNSLQLRQPATQESIFSQVYDFILKKEPDPYQRDSKVKSLGQ